MRYPERNLDLVIQELRQAKADRIRDMVQNDMRQINNTWRVAVTTESGRASIAGSVQHGWASLRRDLVQG
jgi:hypothetical protein